MSATLQRGLASLLVRRTEEGRAKALHGIKAWQKAIEAVRQAERMAEHKINLPNEQVQGVQQAAAQVRTANYVQAVYLENKATTARNAIIASSSRALEEETKHRHRLETTARQEIYTAINERDNAITAAKTKLDAKSTEIQSEIEKESRKANLGAVDFVVSLCGLYIIAKAIYDAVKVGTEGYIFFMGIRTPWWLYLCFGGFLAFPIIIRIVTARAAIRSLSDAPKATCQRAIEAAEKRLREVRPALEENIKHPEAHRKKAEEALQSLKAQA